MNYLFIGDGRVARHLSHYLAEEGQKVAVWSRRSTFDPIPLIQKADVICLSTRDQELRGVIKAYNLTSFNKPIVHFSGSQSVEGAFGFHPLMSFGDELYSKDTYRSINFVGTAGHSDFVTCFPKLKNNYAQIKAEKLALYHAYCSMAGNFPQILWTELSQNFEKELGINSDVLKPYLKQVTTNFIEQGPSALTGPLVRNDNRTVIRHLDALTGRPLQSIYFSFMNFFKKRTEKPHESSGISTNQI